MELTLTIGDGIAVATALNDAIEAIGPVTTSALSDVEAGANGIELTLDITQGSELGDAITDVIAAFGSVTTSSIAALSTDVESDVLAFAIGSSDNSSEESND